MKKALLFAMICLLIVFAAGCGSSNGNESTGSTGSAETSGGAAGGAQTEAGGGKKAASAGEQSDKVFKIGITQIIEHPSLDAAREGFIAALKESGFEEGKNLELDVQIAQGDQPTNQSIAQKFAGDGKDLILAIATDSAQAAAQAIKDTPILFTAITDPLGANLVSSVDAPGGNVTGTSDTHPDAMAKIIQFIGEELPDVKTVGIVVNEGEQNSVVSVKMATELFGKYDIAVEKAAVTNSSEVKQGAESLVGKVDAFYIPKDNTVVGALESVIQVAQDNDIPLFVDEKDSVVRGGFAAYGFEYHDLGYTTGKMAVDILQNGKNPADIPVGFPEELDLVLNLKAAKEMGIEVTDSMKQKVQDQENNIINAE